ncbi:MAG: O-antigen ligase family protein [bacterium]|nr:O-antigen ligase family protein [bacterium]
MAISVVCLGLSTLLALAPYLLGAAVAAAVTVFIICFVSTEASLYLLVLSMLLSPEIGMGALAGDSGTTGGRGVTIRTEDLMLVVMSFAWLVRTAVHKDLGLVRDTPLNQPISAYVVACILATVMGMILGHVEGSTGAFFVLKYIEYFVIYFIVANNVRERGQIRRLTIVMLLTALVVSFIALVQIPSGARVSAPFEGDQGEPNTLGGYLLLIGCVAAGLLVSIQGRSKRLLLVGLLMIMIVPFLLTLSRGSYLALPFAYMALVYLKRQNRFGMVAVFVVLAAIGTLAAPQAVKDRIMYTVNQGATGHHRVQVGNVRLDSSTSARLESWQEAITDWSASPIWGYGVTGRVFLDAQYPRVLAETGLIGGITFAALIFALYRQAYSLYRTTQDSLYAGLSIGLLAGLTGLLVHAVGANTFTIVRIMEPFWLLAGLVVSSAKVETLALADNGHAPVRA